MEQLVDYNSSGLYFQMLTSIDVWLLALGIVVSQTESEFRAEIWAWWIYFVSFFFFNIMISFQEVNFLIAADSYNMGA